MGLPWSEYDVWLSDKRSPVADFLEAVGRIGMAHDRKSDAKWLVCDPMVVAVAICAALVESTEVKFYVIHVWDGGDLGGGGAVGNGV